MFCYSHSKKHLEDNDQNITEANIKGAMKRPIKVNGHKGGRVDIYFCSSVCSIAQLVSRIPSEPEYFLVNFSATGKIAAHLRGSCLYLILIRKSKETHFITNTY